uniref:Uncharacterized protein n=1 Tax=Zonotrichia albicollis TaxID=44394 RepID=A0A8D2QI00_ZONAL
HPETELIKRCQNTTTGHYLPGALDQLHTKTQENEFKLYVHVKQDHTKIILVCEPRVTQQPVNCAAMALMVAEAQKLITGECFIMKYPHLLMQK